MTKQPEPAPFVPVTIDLPALPEGEDYVLLTRKPGESEWHERPPSQEAPAT